MLFISLVGPTSLAREKTVSFQEIRGTCINGNSFGINNIKLNGSGARWSGIFETGELSIQVKYLRVFQRLCKGYYAGIFAKV